MEESLFRIIFLGTFTCHLDCDWQPGNSLKGLKYNITFANQSNETNSCIGYTSLNIHGKCKSFYDKTTLPNLIGNDKIEQIMNFGKTLRIYEGITCYKHLWEVACHIILPKCDPFTKKVMHPCREMCWDVVNGCWNKIAYLANTLCRLLEYNDVYSFDVSTVTNCDYLPSLHGNVSCFYKPVTCDSPPDGTNGAAILNITKKDVYYPYDVVQYGCSDSTFEIIGNDSLTCLYSGEWSLSAPKCKLVNDSQIILVSLALPITFVLLLVIFICIGLNYKRKSSPELKEEKTQLDYILAQLTENDEPLLPSKRQQESTLSLDSPPSL